MKNEKLKTKNLKSNLKSKRVLVGMSGGVDSSVAAALLKKQGYNVIGIFLKFWSDPKCNNKRENTCCNYESLLAARAVCDQLKIPFYVFDVSREFKKEVVDYYINEYDSGRTPNPCVVCNKKIKFGWMLEQAKKLGCEYVATGHYARLRREFSIFNFQFSNKFQIQNSKSQTKLLQALDKKKDQSYFLWQLDQNQLARILFPVGDYTKEEVRKMAKKWKLPTAVKKESQDLCFISTNNTDFLANYADKLNKLGEIVDAGGNILGKHKGLCYYTVGQREGLGVQLKFPISNFPAGQKPLGQRQFPNKSEIRNPKQNRILKSYKLISGFQPAYVLRLDVDKNQLVVGSKGDLYSSNLVAEKVNWVSNKLKSQNSKVKTTTKNLKTIKFQAKIRYGAALSLCHFVTLSQDRIKVVFEKPQRAITPGQSVVFYQGEEEVGGGVIK